MKVVKFEKRVSFEEKLILENLFEEFVNSEINSLKEKIPFISLDYVFHSGSADMNNLFEIIDLFYSGKFK